MKCKKIYQSILLISGITMISYGAVRGEAAVVLGKALSPILAPIKAIVDWFKKLIKPVEDTGGAAEKMEIGRASCRERV